MKNIFKMSLLLAAATLAGCGGGGGSGGESQQQYGIALRSDLAQLPLNINPVANVPMVGAFAPYTTTLYINATEGNRPVPDDTAFSCNLDAGKDTGGLYYMDGDSAHENDDGSPARYGSIVLKSNSGGASFHFHSGNKAGTARIVCTVTDPRDSKIYESSTSISVGAVTGKPAWIIGSGQMSTVLGTRDNLSGLPNSVAIQAAVYDDANQPIPNPPAANVQVSIRPSAASSGAQLVVNGKASTIAQIASFGGVAQFHLKSGIEAGPILLEFVTDRADNNVANGIQQPVTSQLVVEAVHELAATEPLEFVSTSIGASAVNGVPFTYVLEAKGGAAPYNWSLAGGALPTGLTLNSAGLISGTPAVKTPGSFSFVVRVEDRQGHTAQSNMTLTVQGTPVVDPLVITMSGCSGGLNSACALPDAGLALSYQYGFSAVGGDATVPVTWTFSGLPSWLQGNTAGNHGFVTGTPDWQVDKDGNLTGQRCAPVGFFVTATRGPVTASRQVTLNVVASDVKDCPGTTPATPPTTP